MAFGKEYPQESGPRHGKVANETGAGEPAGGYGSTTTEAESEKRTAGTCQPVSELSRRQRTRVASPGAGAVLCAACLLGQLLLNFVFCCFLPIPFGLSPDAHAHALMAVLMPHGKATKIAAFWRAGGIIFVEEEWTFIWRMAWALA